ncbi:kinesin motor domain-containing protein [Pestalotiopsis sp. NC0098]|nr:kinesin motor domain-containing protein [Pestalotiopsis sp. NC0098]
MDQFYLENADLYQKLLKGLKPPPVAAAKTAAVASDAKMIVSARIRPMLEEDLVSRFPCALFSRSVEDSMLDLHDLYNHPSGRPQLRSSTYQMDRVYGSEMATETIYKDLVAGLIPLAWRGGTGSLFAYGQTGSGKTFTISRLETLVVNSLLSQNDSDDDVSSNKRRIYMTIVELAGNSAFDLLSARKSVMILEDAAGATQLFGAREQLIEDKREAALLLRAANRLRRAAPTSKNDGSSRSHAICRVRIEDPSSPDAAGFLYLVDLAGSEVARDIAAHTADRMRETREINTSLSVLKDCIRGRAEWEATKRAKRGKTKKRPHIPFRHCALTKVLKHVFDPSDDRDDSRTVVIACVNPNLADAKSSKNTLRYAEMLRVPALVEEDQKTGIAPVRILSSQDPNPALAGVPFNERVRPGMVVKWKRPETEENVAVAIDQSLAVALCPSAVMGTGSVSVQNEEENSQISGRSGSDIDQNGKSEKWLCALVTPGLAAGSYEINLWQQLDVDISWLVSEVILKYDTNTRYYHVVE